MTSTSILMSQRGDVSVASLSLPSSSISSPPPRTQCPSVPPRPVGRCSDPGWIGRRWGLAAGGRGLADTYVRNV